MIRILLVLSAFALSGCVSTVVGATAGAAVGVTTAVVGTTAKVVGATARAVIPGDSKKDEEKED